MYTILDSVYSKQTQHLYHPFVAGIFCSVALIGTFLSPNLGISLAVMFAITAIVFSLIKSKISRNTFVFIFVTCIVFSLLRLFIIAISSQVEKSSLVLPEVKFPSWLGSLVLGGKVDIDAMVASSKSMTTLVSLVLAISAFSFLVGPNRIIHLIPRRLQSVRELAHISSNVLWRTPNELQLIREAQINISSKKKFANARNIFPAFIAELVHQSPTHAGVFDLRKGSITANKSWHKFEYNQQDLNLVYISFFFAIFMAGLLGMAG